MSWELLYADDLVMMAESRGVEGEGIEVENVHGDKMFEDQHQKEKGDSFTEELL